MPLFDFKCGQAHVTERLLGAPQKEVVCSTCGERALRMLATPTIKLEGVTMSFPTASMKWERIHREMGRNSESNPVPNVK